MNIFDLSAKLTLDTNEYERNISSAAKGADTLKSSFSTAGSGSTTLQNQIAVLAGQYEEAQQKVARLADEFNKSVEATGTTSKETRELAEKLAEAQLEADDLGKSLKAAGGDAEEAGGRFEGLKEKIGKGLKVAAEVGVAAITAAATAVGALAKQSVQSYSEYEQLVGGVEKIFDEVDISGIIADANNAYKDLNMSANEYLTAINQTGAAFAQTMGDEKGYEVARTGMMAIADYASGTGRNLEELNDKYALITRSTSSYQSIADQFSGILPATSAAFLEQAQAAGFLEDSYTSLTEVPIEEYQEAVTKMLEKGVEDMGLAGNTAKEAATTISGSLAMTKAAWQNLLTGLADPNANIDQLIDNMVSSAEAAVTNLLPAVERAITGIGSVIEKLAPIIAERLPSIIESVLPALINAAGALVNGLVAALPTIIQVLVDVLPDIIIQLSTAIIDNLPALLEAVWELITGVLEALWQVAVQLAEIGWEWILNLTQGIRDKISDTVQAGQELWQNFKDNLHAKITEALEQGVEWIVNLIQGIKNKISDTVAAGQELWQNFKSNLASVVGEILALGVEWIANLIQGIRNKIADTVQAGRDLIEQVKSTIRNAIANFREIGGQLMEGLKQGIANKVQSIISSVRGAVQDAIAAAKNLLGIASPSKVFAEIGEYLDEGLAKGIEDKEKEPLQRIKELASEIVSIVDGMNKKVNSTLAKTVEDVAYIANMDYSAAMLKAENIEEFQGLAKLRDAKIAGEGIDLSAQGWKSNDELLKEWQDANEKAKDAIAKTVEGVAYIADMDYAAAMLKAENIEEFQGLSKLRDAKIAGEDMSLSSVRSYDDLLKEWQESLDKQTAAIKNGDGVSEQPINITVKLDGKVVGEAAYKYGKLKARMVGA